MTRSRDVTGAAVVSDALRAWLRERWGSEPPNVIASALVYELAALIARDAPSLDAADALIDSWTLAMRIQIHRLGIGVEHP